MTELRVKIVMRSRQIYENEDDQKSVSNTSILHTNGKKFIRTQIQHNSCQESDMSIYTGEGIWYTHKSKLIDFKKWATTTNRQMKKLNNHKTAMTDHLEFEAIFLYSGSRVWLKTKQK